MGCLVRCQGKRIGWVNSRWRQAIHSSWTQKYWRADNTDFFLWKSASLVTASIMWSDDATIFGSAIQSFNQCCPRSGENEISVVINSICLKAYRGKNKMSWEDIPSEKQSTTTWIWNLMIAVLMWGFLLQTIIDPLSFFVQRNNLVVLTQPVLCCCLCSFPWL